MSEREGKRLDAPAAGLLLAMLATACGSSSDGSGGSSFTKTTPPSDVCSLLTVTDVQGVLPGVTAGAEQQTPDTTSQGFWSRDCKWAQSATAATSVELVVFGATTEQGLQGIKLAAKTGTTNTPVNGLGQEAHYWEESGVGTNGLWAIDGSLSVDVTAYFITPFPTEAQFHPLVAKVLGEIK